MELKRQDLKGDEFMSIAQQAVWDFLLDNYAGPGRATPRRSIIARFNNFAPIVMRKPCFIRLDDRSFREIVSDLVTFFAKPICTTSAGGYFVAETPDDLDHAVAELESRAVAILERAKALKATVPLSLQRRLF